MSVKSVEGISSFPSSGASLLDRGLAQAGPVFLSENQREVDRLVENAVRSTSDGKTLAALSMAGLAGRFVRLGSLSLFESLPSLFVQGSSQALALAGESAVFTSWERGLGSEAGVPSFPKAWAHAALNLGGLKFFGGLARTQNLIAQHLLVDMGLVSAHQLGSALNLSEAPQGSWAQQLLQAEGLNLAMKGSMALLHSFSPGLSSMEKSLDLSLRQKNAGLFSSGKTYLEGAAADGFGDPLIWMVEGEGPKRLPLPKTRLPASPSRLGAGPPVPPAPPDEKPTVPRNPIPQPSVPLPAVPRPAGGSPPRPPVPKIPTASPAEEPRVRLSFTPPAPSAPVVAMGQEQILLLSRTAQEISVVDLRVIPVIRIAAELFHGGFTVQAKEYFDYAASLIDVLPDSGSFRGRILSHLALEQALVGDQAGCKESFGRAMGELNRLQKNSQRTLETILDAYGLVFTLAGDLIGAGRADTATQLLNSASPNYQRVLKGPLPLTLGQEAVLKLGSRGLFEGALNLAGQIPHVEGQRKALLQLGSFYARRQELGKANEILWRLRGFGEKESLHGEVARAYAVSHDWTLAVQNLSMIKNTALNLRTAAEMTRSAFLLGRVEHARNVQGEVARILRERDEALEPQSRGEIFALLAANAALMSDGEGHSRFYYRALSELETWLEGPSRSGLNEQGRNGWAELVFGVQMANQGEKAGELMKDLEAVEKSWLLGQAALKLAQVGRSNLAIVWLGLIPEAYRSEPQRELVLTLLDRGYADRALPFAEKIPDESQRFDALWEIFARHRGSPLPIPPRQPPPLPR